MSARQVTKPDETLRRLVREHIAAWRAYFAQTGGEPTRMFATFKALADHLAEGKEP